MWHGYEWPAFLRFWSETLEQLVNNHAENGGTRSAELLPRVVGPVIPGTGIVMTVSFLERVILDALRKAGSKIDWVKLNEKDAWAKEIGVDLEWAGWPLIDGLTRLRHCFAHEYGRVTRRHLTSLQELSNALADRPVPLNFSGKKFSAGQFFSIDISNEDIVLSASSGADSNGLPLSAYQAIRLIFLSFLEELGKASIVDLHEWKNGTTRQSAR